MIVVRYTYKTKNTCSTEVSFDLDGGIVHKVEFIGGCNGNLKAIAKLAEGESAERLIRILKGNTCGSRKTSCADQFALALEAAIAKAEEKKTEDSAHMAR